MQDPDSVIDPMDIPENFHCYRCGGECSDVEREDNDDVIEYHLTCPECGDFTITGFDSIGWKVKGTDIPYVLGSMSNTATLYHDFDYDSFADEKDAIMAEMDLLDELSDEYITSGDYDSFVSLDKRKKELFERSISIGMDDLRGRYGAYAFNILLDEEVGSDGYKTNMAIFENNIQYMGIDDLSKIILGMFMERMKRSPIASRFEEIADLLYTKADEWNGEYDDERFQKVMMAATTLGLVKEYERPKALMEKCLRAVKDGGVEQSEELTAMVWCDLCKFTFDDDELMSMMDDMRPIREKCPVEFSECAIHFGKELMNVQKLRKEIESDMDWIIGNAIPFIRSFDEADDIEMNARYIRGMILRDRKDVKRSIDIALSDLSENGDEISDDSAWILVDYLENRGHNDRLADMIRQKVRKAGVEMEDLYYYAGF